MKKLLLSALMVLSIGTMAIAQQGDRKPDPKKMSERIAEKLSFTDDQKKSVQTLNSKYEGEEYDRRAYMNDFKKIMTKEQSEKFGEMKARRQKMQNAKRADKE